MTRFTQEYMVSVEDAEATVEEDRVRILAAVAAAPGGADGLLRCIQAAIIGARLSSALGITLHM